MPPNSISSCAEVVANDTICYRQRENGDDRDLSRYCGVAFSICTANDPLCQSGHYNGDRISCHTKQHVSGCDMLAAESGLYQIRREYSIPDTTSVSFARRLHDDDKRSKQPICHTAHFVYKQLQVQHKIPAMSRVHA